MKSYWADSFSRYLAFFISCTVIIFALPGQSMGFCAFTEPILKTTGLSRNIFSMIYMGSTMLGCCGVLFSGPLIDRLGVRRSLLCTLPIWTLTLLIFGLCDNIRGLVNEMIPLKWFYILFFTVLIFILRLLGQNILPLLGRLEVIQAFSNRQGLAIAFCVFIVSFCNGITPACMNLLAQNDDWQHAFRTLSISGAVLFFVVLLLLPKELTGTIEQKSNQPGPGAPKSSFKFRSRFELIKMPIFWCIVPALCLNAFIGSGTVVHIVDIFRERGASESLALNSYIPLCVSTIISGFIFGKLLDLGHIKICIMLMFLSQFLGLTGLAHVEHKFFIMLYIICIGGTWGGYGVLLTAVWPKLFDQKYIGTILGLVYFLATIIGAISVPLMSTFKQFFGSYFVLLGIIRGIIIICAIFCALKFPKLPAILRTTCNI